MKKHAIEISNVSKLYRLGEVGTGTISHDLNRWWHRIRGKEDPYLQLGQENKRDSKGGEYVWAIKDVSFSVEQGEVLGIVGKNGAGKSTLLKLLSRVTAPTTGSIRARGRIASLLEVGTGFHPELTGRENIFLNGAILGMTKQEIKSKFDEIVEFAGVERYIDTPVKRYSSGMYVRLAFGVAAHLESEILIVDEVLAVGDAEFQNKCIGKMNDVSKKEGRTVLFVSHNMNAVKTLCTKGALIERGTLAATGDIQPIIDRYLTSDAQNTRVLSWSDADKPTKGEIELQHISILDSKGRLDNAFTTSDDVFVHVGYKLKEDLKDLRITASLLSYDGAVICCTSDFTFQDSARLRTKGEYESVLKIPGAFLNMGKYFIQVEIDIPRTKLYFKDITLEFMVDEVVENQLGVTINPKPPGLIHPILNWQINKR